MTSELMGGAISAGLGAVVLLGAANLLAKGAIRMRDGGVFSRETSPDLHRIIVWTMRIGAAALAVGAVWLLLR